MPKRHYIKETLDSHFNALSRPHTFMTMCGRRMTQSLSENRVWNQPGGYFGQQIRGNKGTHDATAVTCKECLLDEKVREEIAEAFERRVNQNTFDWWDDDGDRRWKSNG